MINEKIQNYIDEHAFCPEYLFKDWESFLDLLYAEGGRISSILWWDHCTGFAKAYHSLKDYDNEIVILEEGIKYFKKNAGGDLITRRDSAIKALYKKQQAERIAIQKKAEKEAKKQEKERADAAKGVQKHAGGFVWRYKDQIETD